MPQISEELAPAQKTEKSRQQIIRFIISLACTVSLAFYLAFSQGLRFLLSNWEYSKSLVKMAFPLGVWAGLARHIPALPIIPASRNGLILGGFFVSCMASGWLAHSLLRGRRDELGPHLILFSLAAAILPTLFLAMFFWPDGNGKLKLELSFGASALTTVALAVLKLMISPKLNTTKPERKSVSNEKLGWTWVFLPPVIVLFAFSFLNGYISILGFDALAYHLPLAASWFHNSRITRGFDIQFYYPSNCELLIRWSFLDASERFLFIIPYVCTLLCIYMIYKLGRLIGQKKKPAFIAACCSATFPMIPYLASTANTDSLGILFLLISVFFLIRWVQSDRTADKDLVCAGLSVGLAAGTKMSMLTPCFVIFMVMMATAIRSSQMHRSTDPYAEDMSPCWKWFFTRLAIFFSGALVGGGYWYLRNMIEKGNPLYPIAFLGLPGMHMNAIVPTPQIYMMHPWMRFFYPWMEINYSNPYEDGVGAVVAAIVIPAILFWPLVYKKKEQSRIGPGMVFSIACISMLLFLLSDIMRMRMGMFAILISFILIGELLQRVPSSWLKAITFIAFLAMTATITYALARGYLYEYLRTNKPRHARLFVPKVVDSFPPTRIFNAAAAFCTYGLMGRDYRHEVVALFREAKPEDVLAYHASYVLLTKTNIELFQKKLRLELVGTDGIGDSLISLWKVVRAP
jgi:sorbitol-specific phosphotransferase system component IIC